MLRILLCHCGASAGTLASLQPLHLVADCVIASTQYRFGCSEACRDANTHRIVSSSVPRFRQAVAETIALLRRSESLRRPGEPRAGALPEAAGCKPPRPAGRRPGLSAHTAPGVAYLGTARLDVVWGLSWGAYCRGPLLRSQLRSWHGPAVTSARSLTVVNLDSLDPTRPLPAVRFAHRRAKASGVHTPKAHCDRPSPLTKGLPRERRPKRFPTSLEIEIYQY